MDTNYFIGQKVIFLKGDIEQPNILQGLILLDSKASLQSEALNPNNPDNPEPSTLSPKP